MHISTDMNKTAGKLIKLILILSLLLQGCGAPGKGAGERDEHTGAGSYFDTYISIKIYGGSDEIIDGCFDICSHYEELFSKSLSNSDIYRINSSCGKAVKVSHETIKLIRDAGYFYELSGGDFDISIYPLSSLWDFSADDKSIPNKSDIDDALLHVSYDNILINEEDDTITLLDPKGGIDLGGIAKGYIADRLKDYLVSEGIDSAVINLGGNVLVIGSKPGGSPFNIGIQYPFRNTGEVIRSVKVSDKTVVSSGIYERFFEDNGRIYHHILDPKTGCPAESDLLGATVITDSSEYADALSTICFMKGSTGAENILKQLPYKAEAVLVTDEYEIIDISN